MNYLDSEGYPTEEVLELIRTAAPAEALAALRQVWHPIYGSQTEAIPYVEYRVARDSFSPGGKYVRLATGGWSGNEDAIEAYHKNTIAWMVTWRLHAAGGLYIFRVPTL